MFLGVTLAQEYDIAVGVMCIAAGRPGGICTFKRAYREIPTRVRLSAGNQALSATRPGEPMWHQLVRNIKSHDSSNGNFIANGLLSHVPRVGYSVTAKGQHWLRSKKLI